jgi:hypothetical protein
VLFGADSFRVDASIAGDVREVLSFYYRVSIAGIVACEAAWVEGVNAAVSSWPASGPDASLTGPAARVAFTANCLLLMVPV